MKSDYEKQDRNIHELNNKLNQLEEEKNRILHANGALQDTLAFAETKIVSTINPRKLSKIVEFYSVNRIIWIIEFVVWLCYAENKIVSQDNDWIWCVQCQ